MKIDHTTIGSCNASHVLAKILQGIDKDEVSRKALMFLCRRNEEVKQLKKIFLSINDKSAFNRIYQFYIADFHKKVVELENFLPKKVCTHIRTIVQARYRNAYSEIMRSKRDNNKVIDKIKDLIFFGCEN